MKELIDFYVDILDDEETSSILHKFKEKVDGFSKREPPLVSKKIHIKKIFKKQTQKSRKIENPFFQYLDKEICRYSIDIKDLTDKEIKQFISDVECPNQKEYKKVELLAYHSPEYALSLVPNMKENYQNNKKILEFEYQFASAKELLQYLNKTNRYNKDIQMYTLLKKIEECYTEDDLENINKLKNEVAQLDILSFHKKLYDYFEDYPEYIINYTYLKNHPKENKEIMLILAFNMIDDFIESMNRNKDFLKCEYESLNIEYQNLKQRVNEEDAKCLKELRKKHSEVTKELTQLEKNYIEVERQQKKALADSMELQNTVKSLQKNLQKQENNYKEEKNNYIQIINKLTKENQILMKEKEDLRQRTSIYNIEDYYNYDFAIICSNHTEDIKILFPEIYIEDVERWDSFKMNLNIKAINKLYIQRDYIDTSKIIDIITYAKQRNINTHMFFANTTKRLMEYIGHYKCIAIEGGNTYNE